MVGSWKADFPGPKGHLEPVGPTIYVPGVHQVPGTEGRERWNVAWAAERVASPRPSPRRSRECPRENRRACGVCISPRTTAASCSACPSGPRFAQSLKPTEDMCGRSAPQAYATLARWERITATHAHGAVGSLGGGERHDEADGDAPAGLAPTCPRSDAVEPTRTRAGSPLH